MAPTAPGSPGIPSIPGSPWGPEGPYKRSEYIHLIIRPEFSVNETITPLPDLRHRHLVQVFP